MEESCFGNVVTAADLLKCSVCKEILPAESFYVVRGRTNGKRDFNGVIRSCRCKDCQNKDYLKLDPRKKLLYAARKRAKQNGLDCTITVDDIVIPEFCPALGIKLEPRVGAGRSNREEIGSSPSLDRIDNSKGYVPGNVAVISLRANMIKTDAIAAELKAVAAYIDGQPR